MFEHNGTHSWLLEYIHKCKMGEVIIGHELMMMLNILIGHFTDPNIKIEFEDAHKRIDFIETKCKHFEAPFAGKPFILELFQKAFIESIYIFKIYDDELCRWVRLYQDVLYLVAKKNGKTPLIAAICLAEWFCGNLGLKILCSSNDYEQASLMHDAINAMREKGGYELTLKDMNNNCVLNRVNGNSRDAVLKLMGEYVTFKFTPITIRINPIHIGRRH
jgi:phage terminase large subunit-like protein